MLQGPGLACQGPGQDFTAKVQDKDKDFGLKDKT